MHGVTDHYCEKRELEHNIFVAGCDSKLSKLYEINCSYSNYYETVQRDRNIQYVAFIEEQAA